MTEFEAWLIENRGELPNNGYRYLVKLGNKIVRDYDLRTISISKFSLGILTQDTVDKLKKYNPFLEIGCGTGYWAYELAKNGVDIVATDPKPYSDLMGAKPEKLWYDIKRLRYKDAILKFPNRSLLICWPSYCMGWSKKALELYKGRIVVYVGEGMSGCTGSDGFHALLKSNWKKIEEISIPQWPGIHDRCLVYEKKTDA